MSLDYIVWNVDREIFRIGGFALRWYGLLFALGFFLGYLILQHRQTETIVSVLNAKQLGWRKDQIASVMNL